ncbi:MAG: NAD+ synthase, partial [Rhodocyclaceae bacterium]|nr:NAD+ synthase [Rhodocyclaceae bacterium]
MKSLKIAVAQINCIVGDLAGNARKILDAANLARDAGANLLLTPELALCGYPPEDLLLRPDFYRACEETLASLAAELPLPAVVGHPRAEGRLRRNAASLLRGGRVEASYFKGRLPNSEVFDEERYFDAGEGVCIVEVQGTRLGLAICEDVWQPGIAENNRAAGADILLALNASPFHMHKQADRHEVLRERVRATRMPVVYCNMVGGQDELVFDGASFVIDADGRLTHQSPAFREDLAIVEVAGGRVLPGATAAHGSIEEDVYKALTLGVRDYLGKNGFPGAVLGLSGGVDSALTLCIAVDALGADRVRAVMMPSPYTAQMSLDDSRALVQVLGVRYDEVPIGAAMETYGGILAPLFDGLPPTAWADTTPENIQARIRGMILMALSN